MESHRLFVVLASVAALAAGCESSMDPIQVVPKCPDQPVRGPSEYSSAPPGQLIDDFESGSVYLPQVQGRTGYWSMIPDGTSVLLSADVSADCAARGRFAGHFSAYDSIYWASTWTAIFVATPSNLTAAPYDARAYSGISFWAGFGAYNGPEFDVPVGITTMDNAWNSTAICGKKCMDYYQIKVPLTRHWQRFVVRFADMAQEGWGDPIVPMRKDQMVGFIIWPRQQFDIWIDDLRFEP
jgi:hypothetical protein